MIAMIGFLLIKLKFRDHYSCQALEFGVFSSLNFDTKVILLFKSLVFQINLRSSIGEIMKELMIKILVFQISILNITLERFDLMKINVHTFLKILKIYI
jgi:hypothetical protein